jgi:hypothetical protein
MNTKKFLILIIIIVLFCILYKFYEQYKIISKEGFQNTENQMYKINKINTKINIPDEINVKDKYLKIATIKKPTSISSETELSKKLFINIIPVSSLAIVNYNFDLLFNKEGNISGKSIPKLIKNINNINDYKNDFINVESIWIKEIEKINEDFDINEKYYEVYIKFLKEIKDLNIIYKHENLEINDLLTYGTIDSNDLTTSENNIVSLELIEPSNTVIENSILNSIMNNKHYKNINNVSNVDKISAGIYQELNDLKDLQLGNSINIGSTKIESKPGKLLIGNGKMEINNDRILFNLGSNKKLQFKNGWLLNTDKDNFIFSNANKNVFVLYLNNGKIGLQIENNAIVNSYDNTGSSYFGNPPIINHSSYLGNSGNIVTPPWGSHQGYFNNKTTQVDVNYFEGKGGYNDDTPIFAYSTEGIPLGFRKCCLKKSNSNTDVNKMLRGFIFNREGFENSSIYNLSSKPTITMINQINLVEKDKVCICDFSNIENSLIVALNIISLPEKDKIQVLQEVNIIYDNGNVNIDLSKNKVNKKLGISKVFYKDKRIYAECNIKNNYLITSNSTEKLNSSVSKVELNDFSKTIEPNQTKYIYSNNSIENLNVNTTEYNKNLKEKLNNLGLDINNLNTIKINNRFSIGDKIFEILKNGNLQINVPNSPSITISENHIYFNTNKLQLSNKIIENEKNKGKQVLKFSGVNSNYIYRISEKGGSKMSKRATQRGVYIPFALNRQLKGKNSDLLIEGFQSEIEKELIQPEIIPSQNKIKITSKNLNLVRDVILAKISIPQVNKVKYVRFVVNDNESVLLINSSNVRFLSYVKENNLIAYKDGDKVVVSIKNKSNSKINYETLNLEDNDFIEKEVEESETNNESINSNATLIDTIYYSNEKIDNIKNMSNEVKKIRDDYLSQLSQSNINFKKGIILKRGDIKYHLLEENSNFVIKKNGNILFEIKNNGELSMPNATGFSINNFSFDFTVTNYFRIRSKYGILNTFNKHPGWSYYSTPINTGHVPGIYLWNKI